MALQIAIKKLPKRPVRCESNKQYRLWRSAAEKPEKTAKKIYQFSVVFPCIESVKATQLE